MTMPRGQSQQGLAQNEKAVTIWQSIFKVMVPASHFPAKAAVKEGTYSHHRRVNQYQNGS